MDVSKTILSAGEVIREILIAEPNVALRVNKIFPIAEDNVELPYIVYQRTSLATDPTKANRRADTATIEVFCYTEGYGEGVELAECVRNALDGKAAEIDGLIMRSCTLSDSDESWAGDAFEQRLVFTVRI